MSTLSNIEVNSSMIDPVTTLNLSRLSTSTVQTANITGQRDLKAALLSRATRIPCHPHRASRHRKRVKRVGAHFEQRLPTCPATKAQTHAPRATTTTARMMSGDDGGGAEQPAAGRGTFVESKEH